MLQTLPRVLLYSTTHPPPRVFLTILGVLTLTQLPLIIRYEVDVAWDALISHPAEGEWAKLAPMRVLSFDIECAGRKGIFPEAEIDPVIQIANMVQIQGQPRPFVRNIFALNTCANVVGSQVGLFPLSTWVSRL
jgi:DNA polymerase elongation subunit (family B)